MFLLFHLTNLQSFLYNKTHKNLSSVLTNHSAKRLRPFATCVVVKVVVIVQHEHTLVWLIVAM